MLKFVAVLSTLVLAAGCGSSGSPTPTSPISVIGSYDGFWSGTLRVTSCEGSRTCFDLRLADRPVLLRLVQAGSYVEGVIESGYMRTRVAGPVDAAGGLSLTGDAQPPSPYLHAVKVERSALRATSSGLEGTIELAFDHAINPVGKGTLRGEIRSTQRVALPSDAAGMWVGEFYVRDCQTTGPRPCYPYDKGEARPFGLALTQQGVTLSGTMSLNGPPIRVTGTVNGNTITLSGEGADPPFGQTRLLAFTATRDRLGQLQASFRYELSANSPFSSWNTVVDADLWYVTHQGAFAGGQ